MQADRIDLYRLFDPSVTYVAPLFQRPYVWTRSDNWEPLWTAALGVAEQRLSGADPIRPHFMGAVVLNQLDGPTGSVPARELIDGQQRLTTLQLLLAALRDTAAELELQDLRAAFSDLVTNKARFAKTPKDGYKVWPTNADREAFQAAMEPGAPQADGSKLADARRFFHEAVAEWLAQHDDHERALMALYEGLYYDLHLVAIDLDDNDDPQLIFETLNALGTPLLPADLVKNYLFHQLNHDEAEAARLYERHWHPFDAEQDYWRADLRQGRLVRPRIDHYLHHYLALKTKEDVRMDRLFPTFKGFAAASNLPVAEHLADFHAYGDIYRSFSSFPPESTEGVFFHRLDALDTTTVYPLLLEIFARLGDDTDERRQILMDLESFLVRRAVCRLTTKNYNKLFLDALEHVEGDLSASSLRRFLLTREGEVSRWPDDDEFRAAWLESALYRGLVRRRLRMILEALEVAARTAMTEPAPLPPRLTVEHVLPQQWSRTWPFPKAGPNDDRTRLERAADRDHALQTIGNLTLVTKKLNPSMSNGSWATKRAALRKHSALALNRDVTEHDEWNEAIIAKRSKDLFKLAVRIWPYPAGEKPPQA